MFIYIQRCFCILACVLTALWLGGVPALRAADWPRLGGPDGAGVSPETGLARAWPAAGPRVLWSAEVAEGFAGAAVYDGQVYLLDRVEDKQDTLRCWDLESGVEVWRAAYEAPGRLPYNGTRNVPTVDERFIFTVGPLGHVRCLDRRSHQLLWAAQLVDDFKDPEIDTAQAAETREQKLARAQVPMWGVTQAPLLYKDTVILAPQTQKTGLVAYEKATGKIRWRTGYVGRNWYSHVSPCLATLGGVDQVILLAQPSDPEKAPAQAPPALITSVNADTGLILWTNATPGPYKIPIPQPLRVADDRLFITGGFGIGGVMFQVARREGKWESRVAFRTTAAAGFIHSPVLYQDRIYVMSFKDHGGKNTGLTCLSLTGEAAWQTGPALQFDSGALLIADGMALVMHGKTGELHLFDLSPAGAKLLAKAKVLEARHNMVWAPLALSRGKLLARDQHQLICLDLMKP